VPDKELRDASRSGEFNNCFHWVIPIQDLDSGARSLSNRQFLVEGRLIGRRDLWLIDVRRNQFTMEPFRNGLRNFDHLVDISARRYAHKNPLVGSWVLLDAVTFQVVGKLVVYDIGSKHQRQFA
jgi:hypothetical protein